MENTPPYSRYITVEGPIGVGKSSLARKLATSFNSELLLEKPAENPFLARFYAAPRQHALPTQLFFLFQRVRQLQNTQQDDLFSSGRIADFMLEKDTLFAQVTLDNDEFRLYQQVYANLNVEIPKPDLVIYLQAPVSVLLERIEKRGVKYEVDIKRSYLQKLSDAYTAHFHRYTAAPLLIVNAADMNFVDEPSHYEALVNHIRQIHSGKNYFNPLIESL
jgi:deoxyadenosine/deoxycytidine kinase